MIATLPPPSLLDRWRQRLGGQHHRHAQPRPLAALGYLANGPVIDGLIAVENLTVTLLYDEPIRSGHCALRLAGYSGSRVPWGVRFGGPQHCRYVKDLRLQPVLGAQGYRLDLASTELLALGLSLERELDRHARYRQRQVREQALPAEALGRIPPGGRGQHHRRRPGTGRLRGADRQIAPSPAGTPAPRPLRPRPRTAGLDKSSLGTGRGGFCRSGAVSSAAGFPPATPDPRSGRLPGRHRVRFPLPFPRATTAAVAAMQANCAA